MEILIIAGLLIILLSIWIVSTQRKLVVMDENINNAMKQIGVQLSSHFDVLIELLNLVKAYSIHDSLPLIENINTQRSEIISQSTPAEVLKLEKVISETMHHITIVAEQYPDLQSDKNYVRYTDAVNCYAKMEHTSHLIYNDSVTKLNRTLRMIPISLIAGILGFRQREYLT